MYVRILMFIYLLFFFNKKMRVVYLFIVKNIKINISNILCDIIMWLLSLNHFRACFVKIYFIVIFFFVSVYIFFIFFFSLLLT